MGYYILDLQYLTLRSATRITKYSNPFLWVTTAILLNLIDLCPLFFAANLAKNKPENTELKKH